MSFHDTMNPTGGVVMGRVIEVPDPDEHLKKRVVGENPLSGYGSIGFMNRLVRTRMPGGVGRGREKLPLTRLD